MCEQERTVKRRLTSVRATRVRTAVCVRMGLRASPVSVRKTRQVRGKNYPLESPVVTAGPRWVVQYFQSNYVQLWSYSITTRVFAEKRLLSKFRRSIISYHTVNNVHNGFMGALSITVLRESCGWPFPGTHCLWRFANNIVGNGFREALLIMDSGEHR